MRSNCLSLGSNKNLKFIYNDLKIIIFIQPNDDGVKIPTVIGGTLSGDVGAAMVGGDFYQGAVFGLISTSLNHLVH